MDILPLLPIVVVGLIQGHAARRCGQLQILAKHCDAGREDVMSLWNLLAENVPMTPFAALAPRGLLQTIVGRQDQVRPLTFMTARSKQWSPVASFFFPIWRVEIHHRVFTGGLPSDCHRRILWRSCGQGQKALTLIRTTLLFGVKSLTTITPVEKHR